MTVFQYDNKLPASFQWNVGVQMMLPFSSALDVSYTGQHSFNTQATVNLNTIDLGMAFRPADTRIRRRRPAGVTTSLVEHERQPGALLSRATQRSTRTSRSGGGRTTRSSSSWSRRLKNGVAFGFNDTISLSDKQQSALRLQHNADGTITVRADQAEADELLGDNHPQTHIMRANFIWQLPDYTSSQPVLRVIGLIVNDWDLAGIWSGATGSSYSVGFNYANGGGNLNLTGSPDYAEPTPSPVARSGRFPYTMIFCVPTGMLSQNAVLERVPYGLINTVEVRLPVATSMSNRRLPAT